MYDQAMPLMLRKMLIQLSLCCPLYETRESESVGWSEGVFVLIGTVAVT